MKLNLLTILLHSVALELILISGENKLLKVNDGNDVAEIRSVFAFPPKAELLNI